MRVAVVGGGIFGCTAATYLARAGHDVHLLEAKDSLLRCASGINQFRLHRGYHYPRSPETIKECLAALESFNDEYGDAVHISGSHLYAIARRGSKLDAAEYINALLDAGLNFHSASARGLVNMDEVEAVLEVEEPWLDVSILRGEVWFNLAMAGVNVHVNAPADSTLRDEFDKIVVAGYASTNNILALLDCEGEQYQYEVCEKLVLAMPEAFRRTGIVVMDGSFCSLDPFLGTPYHVMGHVSDAIHSTNVGQAPHVPQEIRHYIDRGVVYSPPSTHWRKMRASGSMFVPALVDAEHIGSMFTVRAVLPDRDETDARPTMVDEIDGQVIRVFSGKIGCAVEAAKRVVELVGTQTARIAA